ncbi:hypothetical protein AZZ85_005100, partial [Klebsiella pneumoniae]
LYHNVIDLYSKLWKVYIECGFDIKRWC